MCAEGQSPKCIEKLYDEQNEDDTNEYKQKEGRQFDKNVRKAHNKLRHLEVSPSI